MAMTLVLIGAIVVVLVYIWDSYMYTPWTRDGRVRADVVNIAPDVSGWIDELHAQNSSEVKTGDVLFTVDHARYQVAVDLAQAQSDSAKVGWDRATNVYKRRTQMSADAVSREEVDTSRLDMMEKQASYKQSVAVLNSAKIDLARTTYTSPASGKIVNLELEKGDYVNRGVNRLALVKDDSYYVTGYFEETKIPGIKIGDKVEIWLMAGTLKLEGHVESIDSGISNSNSTPGNQMLPSVEATFAWVRLAQRIPVNIKIDQVPEGVNLSSGMSATLKVVVPVGDQRDQRSVLHALSENVKSLL
ncbi:efflux RND transporter periplasmic adaptor subunit [Pseudomonas extremaustralis]|uniref:efflux RND transporter periplasmic adaptor subunit n=1 Tax=Pseudomonas extremaustralis TaxID=359110 RepID=UPI002AA8E2C2|nr:efflux RND transporter periplasmic adaptor subunit [Pseudomonas extremaustralis]